MQATIEPGSIAGTIAAPPSKSYTQRVFAAALLNKGKAIVHGAGSSADESAALHIIRQLGAEVVARSANVIEILSQGVRPVSSAIHCGESGLAARLFTPIAATVDAPVSIEGAGSLLQRPMKGFAEVLPTLGVGITGGAYLPITVKGPLQPQSVSINAADSSQFLSGLLFACCSNAIEPVTITVEGLASKPYIDLTLAVLRQFGYPLLHSDYKEFHIDPALFTHKDVVAINVEGDWSSAANLLVAGTIGGDITVSNLDLNSTQADRAILQVLQLAGASVAVSEGSVSAKRARMSSFEFDATDCPDLFPVLAILAACCDGESYITGVHRLFHKESNRAHSISEMLDNFAVPFSVEDDVLCVTGVRRLRGTVIDGYNDHRIVMAAAIGALRASGPVDILQADAVSKSYPAFFEDLISCGGKCIFSEA